MRLSRGSALEAVMASAAIPGVFPSVEWQGRELIDGGVANNAPISHALELGAETIYVLPTGNACDLPEPPHGALAMLLHSMSPLVMRRLLIEIELLKDHADLIVLPPPCPLRVSPVDFERSDELVEQGYAAASEHLDGVACGRTPGALTMTMHGHRPASKRQGKNSHPGVAKEEDGASSTTSRTGSQPDRLRRSGHLEAEADAARRLYASVGKRARRRSPV